MSGLAAIYRSDGTPPDPACIKAMTQAMDYCGPDGMAHWQEGGFALGYCAMHATAESRTAAQPLASSDGHLQIIFDGYLANYDEIRRDLEQRGCRLRSRSDAELVLQSWLLAGEDCLARFDGEFAMVLVDTRRGTITCARDHIGLRPLFYHWDGTKLTVASHVTGVLAGLDTKPPVNLGFLAEVMTFRIVTPGETAWTGIERLRPAHVLRVHGSTLERSRYWRMPDRDPIRYRSDNEYVEHYREVLTQSVRRASRTDSPLAAECSGGLDSSAVVALARELQLAGTLPAPDLRAYSFATPAGSNADEIAYARAVADHVGLDLAEIPLFIPGLDWFDARGAADRDLAPYPNTAMLTGMGETMVANGSRAVLNGQGGDHFLTGTRLYYHEALTAGDLRHLASSLRTDLRELGLAETARSVLHGGIAPLLPDGAYRHLKRIGGARLAQHTAPDADDYYWLTPPMRVLLRRRIEEQSSQLRYHRHYKGLRVANPGAAVIADGLSRQSARIGYEMRTPMMSRAIMEFYARTPERTRLQGKTDKRLHRLAMVGHLPEMVLRRDDKASFELVYEENIAALKASMLEEPPKGATNLVEKDAVRKLFYDLCVATIDEVHLWNVWGTYVVLQFAGMYEARQEMIR